MKTTHQYSLCVFETKVLHIELYHTEYMYFIFYVVVVVVDIIIIIIIITVI